MRSQASGSCKRSSRGFFPIRDTNETRTRIFHQRAEFFAGLLRLKTPRHDFPAALGPVRVTRAEHHHHDPDGIYHRNRSRTMSRISSGVRIGLLRTLSGVRYRSRISFRILSGVRSRSRISSRTSSRLSGRMWRPRTISIQITDAAKYAKKAKQSPAIRSTGDNALIAAIIYAVKANAQGTCAQTLYFESWTDALSHLGTITISGSSM